MILMSCSQKFHAFNLAEQLAKNNNLKKFFTLYYSKKNNFYKNFHHRRDKEEIPLELVDTNILYLPFFYFWKDEYKRSDLFDLFVSKKIMNEQDYKIFIGWSGMSLRCATQAKKDGKIVFIERGSSHIIKQNEILSEEYKNYGIEFSIDNRFIEKELREYEIADYIIVPSDFVYKTFLEKGITKNKLFKNPYGVSSFFKRIENKRNDKKFRILYLGALTIRKGLRYLFDALKMFDKFADNYEVIFIGSISSEIKKIIQNYDTTHWRFLGHINHYQLSRYLAECDIAVQPSLEEGLSMVIPQILSCGVPIIATTNSGAGDIIDDNKTGFIIPIKNSNVILEKLVYLYTERDILAQLKLNCKELSPDVLSWDSYGKRYTEFINNLLFN